VLLTLVSCILWQGVCKSFVNINLNTNSATFPPPTMSTLTFKDVPSSSLVSQSLLSSFESELKTLYPTFTLTSGPSATPEDFSPPHGAFCVGYVRVPNPITGQVESTPVACGGVKNVGGETFEVKRMFVASSFRGRGFGVRLLACLEGKAVSMGGVKVRMDTGGRQEEAVALYDKMGYEPVPPFNDNEFAEVWLEKTVEVKAGGKEGGVVKVTKRSATKDWSGASHNPLFEDMEMGELKKECKKRGLNEGGGRVKVIKRLRADDEDAPW